MDLLFREESFTFPYGQIASYDRVLPEVPEVCYHRCHSPLCLSDHLYILALIGLLHLPSSKLFSDYFDIKIFPMIYTF